MGNELKHLHDTTGSTLYAVVFNAAGQIWDTTGTPAFEALTTAAWANGDYDVALSAVDSSRWYLGTFPATIAAGDYTLAIYEQVGGSPAFTDTLLATTMMSWNGSAEVDATAIDTLTKAGGDGDLAAIKTAADAIDALTKAGGDGDLAAILVDTGNAGILQVDIWTATDALDALSKAVIPEITGGADAPAEPTPVQALMLPYQDRRNASKASGSTRTVANDAGEEVLTAITDDDNGTFNQGKLGD